VQRIVLVLVVHRTYHQTGLSVQVLAQQELKLAQLSVELAVVAFAEELAEADCIARELKHSCQRG